MVEIRSLFLSLILLFALTALTTVAAADATTTKTQTQTNATPTVKLDDVSNARVALLVAIPLPGHVNPLLSQGYELRRRGWRVSVASPSRMQHHIQNALKAHPALTSHEAVSYVNLGDCSVEAELRDVLVRAAAAENYMESANEMFLWSVRQHQCMFTALRDHITSMKTKPNVIIADFASYAAFDAADAFGIPCVINNPDLLNMLSPEVVAPYDFVPGTMSAASISTINGPDSLYGLVPRMIYPALRWILRGVAEVTAGKILGEQQQALGLPVTGVVSRMINKLILVNNVFGLEYSRPLSPNIVMVGPMLDSRWMPQLSAARALYRSQLSDEDNAWLSFTDPVTKTNLPVVWVSMGTIAPLNERQVGEMYTAFSAAAEAGNFRVLWKLEASARDTLPPNLPSSQRLRIVKWVSSQLGVLAHDATAVFLSHCGINSVHESVYLGTKLLCIPMLADQADMAARVHDSGIGSFLNKATFDAAALTHAISKLLAPTNAKIYSANLERTRSAMLLSGGVERAVDYIEFVANHGTESLVPVETNYPWYARWSFDVFLIHFVVAYLLYRVWWFICCTARPGKECVQDRKKIRETSEAHVKKHQ